MSLDKGKDGKEFENYIHEILFYNLRVLNLIREVDIKRMFGKHVSDVDHFFQDCEQNKVFNFCIQDKWQDKNAPISDINHFILCIHNIFRDTQHPTIGIYLSKRGLTKDSMFAFENENLKNRNIYLIDIHLEEYEILSRYSENILIEKLLTYLHFYHRIWTYEQDGAVIMR